MNIKQAKKLFTKYINNECSKEEIQLLDVFLDSYQDKNNIWPEPKLGKEEVFKKISWSSIESHINKDRKRIRYPFKPYFKYAAAAVLVGILMTTYFLKNNYFNNDVKNSSPIIVNSNPIIPGTDKAILTLEDGSQIALEKGTTVQTQNANSDGEGIIYKSGKPPTNAIVYNYLTIPRGGQFFIKLSDGTQVWLNSESQLKYPVNFIDGETRQVELVYGEAYFDVSPSTEHGGSKFKVFNKSQEVEVLGTEFNIKAYKDESNIYTTLVEGKVVVDNGMIKQNLEPNLQSNLNTETNNITIAKVDVKGEISWKNGVLIFIDKPLKDIMRVISRWYDVDIIFENKELESVEFVGVIDKQQSIEEILSIMKSISINSYKINNKTIILK